MKVSMFLSVNSQNSLTFIGRQAVNACASMKFAANVTPMFSSIQDKGTDNYHIKSGARIDLLSVPENCFDDILYLWKRLQDLLDIHCVWLHLDNQDGMAGYSGCIKGWHYYQHSYPLIHPSGKIKCTCEIKSDNPNRVRNGKPLC